VESYNYQCYFIAVSFSTLIQQVYLYANTGYVLSYKLPSDISITDNSDTYYTKLLTFNGTNRTILLCVTSNFRGKAVETIGRHDYTTSSDNEGCVAGFYHLQDSTTLEEIDNFSNTWMNPANSNTLSSPYSKVLGMAGYKFSITKYSLIMNANTDSAQRYTTCSYANSIAYLLLNFLRCGYTIDEIIEFIADSKTNDGFINFSDTYTNSAGANVSNVLSSTWLHFGSTASALGYDVNHSLLLAGITKLPFVIDLSGYTGSTMWSFTKTTTVSQEATYLCPLFTLQGIQTRLKLPSTCDVNLQKYGNSYMFDLASYEYIAQNAPSVTSKNLYVGSYVLSLMTRLSAWASVKSTLEGKGWTISKGNNK
jgi:hypothetical protein